MRARARGRAGERAHGRAGARAGGGSGRGLKSRRFLIKILLKGIDFEPRARSELDAPGYSAFTIVF